jgi:hypothetical protein
MSTIIPTSLRELFGLAQDIEVGKPLIVKERETGIEPATSSLGKWTVTENKGLIS